MRPEDAVEIRRQASQRVQMGLSRDMTLAEAAELVDEGAALTAFVGARIVACFGIRETFPGAQGVAWALLAEGLGGAHLAVTRAARRLVMRSPLARIEAIVRADVDAEVIWARLVGLTAAHVLRKFGAASEDHILFERIR